MSKPAADALATTLAGALAPWFEEAQRDLSWRRTRDPYAVWVSEIMLQQTRVETVERYFTPFVQRFPSVAALADAEESAVLEAWSGLGYYRRARFLHRGARYVAQECAGVVPCTADALRRIPGVGPYTAGAIASIAFDAPAPLVDGNVARVFSRLQALEDPKAQDAKAKEHWALAEAVLRRGRPRVLAQALMELGATVCTPKSPKCADCPVSTVCAAKREGSAGRIPAPKVRVAQPVDALAAVAVVVRGRLLLVRRPATGLLASMWSLPLVPLGKRGPTRLGAVFAEPKTLPRGNEVGELRHVFTHRIWELKAFRYAATQRPDVVAEACDIAWVRAGERPEGGLPSVTAKLLRMLEYG